MLMLLFDAIFVVFMYMLPLSDCSSCLLSHHLLYDCAALGAAVALSLWPRLNRIEAARTALVADHNPATTGTCSHRPVTNDVLRQAHPTPQTGLRHGLTRRDHRMPALRSAPLFIQASRSPPHHALRIRTWASCRLAYRRAGLEDMKKG